jgi:hypothetical protein
VWALFEANRRPQDESFGGGRDGIVRARQGMERGVVVLHTQRMGQCAREFNVRIARSRNKTVEQRDRERGER